MGAIGYTSGDPQKVSVSGDTMTGDLILAGAGTDLTVGGDATVSGILTDGFQGMTGDVMRLVSTTLSTGITSGGIITVNAGDPTKVDISATTGWVVDYNPHAAVGPVNPRLTYVTYPGQTAIALVSPTITFWLIDSTGAVVQQTTPPTATQWRTHLVVGISGFVGGVIPDTTQLPTMLSQPANQLIDLFASLGAFKINGNVISPNGINLSINSTGGPVFIPGFGYPNHLTPNNVSLAAQTPITFRRATGTAVLPALTTLIDVANFDPNGLGVITPVGGGANTSTIFRVFAYGDPTTSDQVTVQYGQTAYASLTAAVAAVGRGGYLVNPLLQGAVLIAYVCVTRTATNLSDPTQATIVAASKFPTP